MERSGSAGPDPRWAEGLLTESFAALVDRALRSPEVHKALIDEPALEYRVLRQKLLQRKDELLLAPTVQLAELADRIERSETPDPTETDKTFTRREAETADITADWMVRPVVAARELFRKVRRRILAAFRRK